MAWQMTATGAIPFSPSRLIGLLVWFYLCLYTVQLIEIRPLVQSRWKKLYKVAALMLGPALLLALAIKRGTWQGHRSWRPFLQPCGLSMPT
ncbi:MAG: hypothetical protein QHH07_12790 [Sedimentisphaerales bacterium]|nr:hypothetical protein [Sedimentisphaerales bacterium]